ncbi:MAG: nickel-responsive transcriptional regulator NikR [Planctomycetota bacterium]
MSDTVRFGVSLDISLLDNFDALIKNLGYENRSEAIRDLIRQKLVQEEWDAPDEETFGIVFLVYDHHEMSVDKRLTEEQHHSHGNVISTLHVHIDEDNCMEIVVLRGNGQQIREFGQTLISMRGVKYGKINLGTTGEALR